MKNSLNIRVLLIYYRYPVLMFTLTRCTYVGSRGGHGPPPTPTTASGNNAGFAA